VPDSKVLKVDPDELTALAENQKDASATFDNVVNAADMLGFDCWTSHGVFVGAFNAAVCDLEPARRAAGGALKGQADFLAEQVDEARKRYAHTDQQHAESIEQQVLDA
jgi:hypothetical protein